MTQNQKLAQLNAFLLPDGAVYPEYQLIAYLNVAKTEILMWRYNGQPPDDVTDVPPQYENIQVMAVLVGLGIAGADGQTAHNENGVSRTWKYSNMLEYIHSVVIPIAVVI